MDYYNDAMQRYRELRRWGRLKNEKGAKAAYHWLRSAVYGKVIPSAIVAFIVRLTDTGANRAELQRIIKAYAPAENLSNGRWLRKTKRDIYFTKFYNWIDADEYFRYQFEDLSRAGRWLYIGDAEFGERCRLIDDAEEVNITKDKYNSYRAFQPYYKREALLVSSGEDEAAFSGFCSRHPEFFVKPLSERGGHGVQSIKLNPADRPEDVLKQLLDIYGSAIVEQPIIQAEEMAKYHPNSINTVRVVTMYRQDGSMEVIQTSVRLGTGDSVVDNGCLSSSVDTETGIITSPGRAAHEKGVYLRHPDTGVQILGNRIPAWEELMEQVREQAAVFKKQRFIGWDMAYSTDGWVIVEVNSHPALQTLSGKGVGARALCDRVFNCD
ncbi:MAG: hypothetical protein IIZ45_05875 [Firmicutes bacterium]|nr:hypothetical protein [Bacillota bacterium]